MDDSKEAKRDAGRWCILRTAGARTLPLADSLAEAGFEVWTPRQVIKRRLRRNGEPAQISVAMLPTFVFARAIHLPDLARVLALAINPHPAFSIFRYAGRIPLIADSAADGLRREEERAALAERKKERVNFARGAPVRVEDGAWQGLSGVVVSSSGKEAVISFGGTARATIASWLLRVDDVEQREPMTGAAA